LTSTFAQTKKTSDEKRGNTKNTEGLIKKISDEKRGNLKNARVSATSTKFCLRPVSPMENAKLWGKRDICKVQKTSSKNKYTSKAALLNPMTECEGDTFWSKYHKSSNY
jgi:hypothetical protein